MNTDIFAMLFGGAALAIVAVAVKQQKREYGIAVSIAVCVLVFFISVRYISPLLDFVSDLCGKIGFSEVWLKILFKVLGITLVAQFSGDICRDCGETALANKLETAGKVFILIVSLPLLKNLLGIIASFA